jgi:hypothetical protein
MRDRRVRPLAQRRGGLHFFQAANCQNFGFIIFKCDDRLRSISSMAATNPLELRANHGPG